MADKQPFDQWAIVELMGHVRLAGRVTEEEVFGGKLGRIDIPRPASEGGGYSTKFFGVQSVYCLSPVTEQAARSAAAHVRDEPVRPWEMPQRPLALETTSPRNADDDEVGDERDLYGGDQA